MTGMIDVLYNKLLQRGYKLSELYDMTFRELVITVKQTNKGLAYKMWRQASLIGSIFTDFPTTPEDACPELAPPKPRYEIPDFLVEKAVKRGVM